MQYMNAYGNHIMRQGAARPAAAEEPALASNWLQKAPGC